MTDEPLTPVETTDQVHILACIADWPRLLEYQRLGGEDFSNADASWYGRDTFTRWNDSLQFNTHVGELFLDLRSHLPEAIAGRIGRFLVTFCPALAEEGLFSAPKESSIHHEKLYASLSPKEVRRRLDLLYELDLQSFLTQVAEFLRKEPDELITGQRDVAEFLFMWAAAMGQAASKGWGLLVFVD
jgi:hypothetical protein